MTANIEVRLGTNGATLGGGSLIDTCAFECHTVGTFPYFAILYFPYNFYYFFGVSIITTCLAFHQSKD